MRSALRSQTLADPALAKLLSLAAGKQMLAKEELTDEERTSRESTKTVPEIDQSFTLLLE
jgi:hypothetical protein